MRRPRLSGREVVGSRQGCFGVCAHRGAGSRGDVVGAEPGGDGACDVVVQAIKGETVVEQRRQASFSGTASRAISTGPLPGVPGGDGLDCGCDRSW